MKIWGTTLKNIAIMGGEKSTRDGRVKNIKIIFGAKGPNLVEYTHALGENISFCTYI